MVVPVSDQVQDLKALSTTKTELQGDIIRNERPFGWPVICIDTNSQCYFVRRHLNNVLHKNAHLHFYHPQCSCGKVMFLHLSVSNSVHRGWGCLADTPR